MSQTSFESTFFAALELPPGEPRRYLDGACGGDAELRVHREDARGATGLGDFLDQPHPVPAEALRDGAAAFQPPAEHSGAVIASKYKLIERIGEGGMGSVWMAQQLQPVKRRVAVKAGARRVRRLEGRAGALRGRLRRPSRR